MILNTIVSKTGLLTEVDNKANRLYNTHINLTKGTKMTLKQKALLQTLSIFVGIVVGSLLLNVILQYASTQLIQYVFGAMLIGFLVYGVYGVVLSRLEHDQKLDEIKSKN